MSGEADTGGAPDALTGSMTGTRIGPYLLLRDQSGLRHLARINSVSLVSEIDEIGDETMLIISSRPIRLSASLDEVLDWLGVQP
ncbi:hypothetical protein SAE02_61770 [Skermanella aerolata]|uniref:Uncharacterized protein n=1 Tax=Skermanella aerolata TaxID=393310 RepID=A0A512E021_9PROT|nr:hypothetical protein [Skermanella aerolata]KJB91864.1 hypothetical protein N826_25445 [Skermanella aerolata KACC 11604]GEO42029.1 hypothetical protein SAE02_61770 [Skermanella aerolata]